VLERCLYAADPGVLSPDAAARALALGASADAIRTAQREAPPHAVGVPLVTPDGRAFVRLFHVSFDPYGAGHEALGDEAEAACRHAIARAATLVPAGPDPTRYRFVPASSALGLGALVDGRSLSAAAFLSALSMFSDRPVLAGVVVTGDLHGDAIGPVGSIEAKAEAARAHGARAFFVPAEQAEGGAASGVGTLAELATQALASEVASTDPELLVRRATEAFRDGWTGYRWRGIREALTRALALVPKGRPDLSVDVLARLAAAERHLGDLDASERALGLARALSKTEVSALGDEVLAALARQEAMTLKSSVRFGDARKVADRAIRIARKARLRGELEKSLGCAGLIAMARGDDERALALLREALAITLERTPRNAARSRAYCVEALGHLGRVDEATEEAALALDEAAHDGGAKGRAKAAWVRTSLGSALVGNRLWRDAREALDVDEVLEAIRDEPLPGLLARRWLGVALLRDGDAARGARLLEGSPTAYGAALEPALRFTAQVNTIFAIAEGSSVEVVERALAPLMALPGVAKFLEAEVKAVRRALTIGASANEALEKLAARASRLG
jgi:tetratricopeptide (TPR) repeat protein